MDCLHLQTPPFNFGVNNAVLRRTKSARVVGHPHGNFARDIESISPIKHFFSGAAEIIRRYRSPCQVQQSRKVAEPPL